MFQGRIFEFKKKLKLKNIYLNFDNHIILCFNFK